MQEEDSFCNLIIKENEMLNQRIDFGIKMDGTVSQRYVSKFKIEVRICIPAIK